MNVIQRKVRRWRHFSWKERGLLLQAWLLLPVFIIGLRLFGLQRFQQFLQDRLPDRSQPGREINNDFEETKLPVCYSVSKIVKVAARYSLVTPKCLPKSLLLWWFLGREGIKSDLRLGVQKENEQFEAHAWVEYKGTVLNDSPLVNQRYTTFVSNSNDPGKVF